MTLWNPMNVFSSSQRRSAGNRPSASFDPSRIGDPVDPSTDRPAIGFGETGSDAPSGGGESRRHPVGFAPWDVGPTQRYVTEFSFKRHHDTPRANATGDHFEGGNEEPWQTPEPAQAEGTMDFDETLELDGESPTAEVVEKKVPFYKREIGFHRKRTSAEEPIEQDASTEDGSTESIERAGSDDDGDLVSEHVDAVATSDGVQTEDIALELTAEHVVDPLDPEVAHAGSELDLPDEPDLPVADDDAVTKVPFYKREISFRRKSAASSEETSDPVAVADPDVADDPVSQASSDDDSIAEAAESDGLVVAGVVASADEDTPELSVEEPVDLDAGDGPIPTAVDENDSEIAAGSGDGVDAAEDVPVDVDPVDVGSFADDAELVSVGVADDLVDDVELVPVGVDAAMLESETPSELDDLFIEDTPPSKAKGRFSARRPRKGEQGEKTPKRKAARGGGAKGRHVVGLKIGASQIAAAVVVESNGKHELVDLARRPLAAGIVVDGEVKDVDALSNALKAFFDEEKLPKKDVRIGLASNRIGVRTFDIVGIDDETRFDNAVRFRAHEVLPVAAHESVLDYRVLEERPNEAGEPTRRVLLVVAPSDQVEPYAEVARRVGIKLSGIDLEALGLLRAFVEPKPFAVRGADDTATVVVSIGHESSTLLVAGGGACEFTRVFAWGGSALVEAIASTLEVHPAEAATILKHLSLSGPGRQFDGLDDVSRTRALDAVRLRLTPFARELVSSLQFYQTQDESLGIGGVVITGGTSHLEGLGEALNQMIGVNVSVGDPLARVTTSLEISPEIDAIIGSMAVPIGLAIDDIAMRSVDLLPKDAVKTRSTRSTMIAVGAPIAAAVPLIALGAMYLGAHGKAADSRAELAAVKAEIAALPTPTGPDIDASVVGDEAARATAIASVLGGRLAWDSVFRDMARVFPTNVWLKSLSANLPEDGNLADGTTAAAAATTPGGGQPAPTAVVIEGYTYTQPDVARLLARLATLPSLKRVTLTSSQRETVGKKEVVRFVIVADLSTTGGAS